MTAPPTRLEPDLDQEVLRDLYSYRRKRARVAWTLWATLGWLGAHRFYLERPGSGVVMLMTGGGGLVWWVIDAPLLGSMLRAHNAEQARREEAGLPPVELAFMPPLAEAAPGEAPSWTAAWHARGPARRALRLTGDVLVLLAAGTMLGTLAGVEGATEAVVAVTALIGVTLLGAGAARVNRVPVARGLVRWAHRLRLFYHFNRPGTPPGLLLRSVIGIMLAPFRRRDRAEVRLYLQLGAAFTIVFLLLDLFEDLAVPLVRDGLGALDPLRLLALWLQEGLMTFLVIYAFAAPIGAVLTLYVLTRPTHALARILGAVALLAIALGITIAP